MLNIITITNKNGNTTTKTLDAPSIFSAYAVAKDAAAEGDQIRVQIAINQAGKVDDLAICRAALHIAARAAKTVDGDPTIQRCGKELSLLQVIVSTDRGEGEGAPLIMELIRKYSQEANDIYAFALEGVWKAIHDGVGDNSAIYSSGYMSVNGWLTAEKRKHIKELTTDYTMDAEGELIPTDKYTAEILNLIDDAPLPDAIADDPAPEGEDLDAVIFAAAATLAPRQREIIHAIAGGCSLSQAADRLKTSKVNVSNQLTLARANLVKYLKENCPAALDYVNALDIVAIGAKLTAQKHGEDADAAAEKAREEYIKDAATNDDGEGENYRAALDSARYTYGKYYMISDTNYQIAAAKLSDAIEKIADDIAAARDDLAAARAASGVSDLQIARAHRVLSFGNLSGACKDRARAIIAASLPICRAAARLRELLHVKQDLYSQYDKLKMTKAEMAKRAKKAAKTAPAPATKYAATAAAPLHVWQFSAPIAIN